MSPNFKSLTLLNVTALFLVCRTAAVLWPITAHSRQKKQTGLIFQTVSVFATADCQVTKWTFSNQSSPLMLKVCLFASAVVRYVASNSTCLPACLAKYQSLWVESIRPWTEGIWGICSSHQWWRVLILKLSVKIWWNDNLKAWNWSTFLKPFTFTLQPWSFFKKRLYRVVCLIEVAEKKQWILTTCVPHQIKHKV